MNLLIRDLIFRANHHDDSKLKEPEYHLWKAMDSEPRFPYGSEEYDDKMRRYKKAFTLHYAANRHHPEHFMNGISDMTLVDLIEMICDWLSYYDNIRVTEAIDMIDLQSKRFDIPEEVQFMIANTMFEYFAVLGDDAGEPHINSYPKLSPTEDELSPHLIDMWV